MLQKYFNRFELKYQISLKDRDKIIRFISPFMELDSYIKNKRSYQVRSVYFDSISGKSYYEKIDGIQFRVKLRIRYYPDFQDSNNEVVFLELKRKTSENVGKSRVIVPFEKAFKILKSNTMEAKEFYNNASNQDKKTLEEIWVLYKRYNLRPVCVVCYTRQPYLDRLKKRFRITFDANIKVRNFNFNLHIGGGSKYIVPPHICVMEIKFNNFMPNWAVNLIQRNNCIQQKLSKFANGLKQTKIFTIT